MISEEMAEKHGLNKLILRVKREGRKLTATFWPFTPILDSLIDEDLALTLSERCLSDGRDEAQIMVNFSETVSEGFDTQLPSYKELATQMLLALQEQSSLIRRLRETFNEDHYRSCTRAYTEMIACHEIEPDEVELMCPFTLDTFQTFVDPEVVAVFGEKGYMVPGAPHMLPAEIRADIDAEIWRMFRRFAAEELLKIHDACCRALDGVDTQQTEADAAPRTDEAAKQRRVMESRHTLN